MGTRLEEISGSIADIASAAGPSVVGVGRAGSGVVIGEGLVLTNAHNLRGGEARLRFHDGREAVGSVTAVDPDGDLAIVTVDTAGVPPLRWSDRPARLGDVVIGLANPAGRGLRLGVGFVSSLEARFTGPTGTRLTGAIGHSALLPRGSSGGPLLDSLGGLLGINTHRASEGFYIALAGDEELRARIDGLSRGEAPRRPRLGVALAPPRLAVRLRRSVGLPDRDGLLVQAVEDASPADRSGLRQGDLIVMVGSRRVASVDELAEALASASAEGSVDVGVVRGVDEMTVAVDLYGNAPPDQGSV